MAALEIQSSIRQLWETGSKDLPEARHSSIPEEESEHPGYPVLLDSLASVLVSRARGESIAVGAQLDSGNITLTLASNERTVPEETCRHAEMLLEQLRRFGRDFEGCRREKLARQNAPVGNKHPRLEELASRVREDVQAFESRVYRFSLCKLWRRLNKPYKPAGKASGIPRSEFFFKHIGRLRQSPDEVVKNIKDIPAYLGHLYAAVRACRTGLNKTDEEQHLLLISLASRQILQRVQRISAVKGWQQRLTCKLGEEAKAFPFDRFLQNITILPSATTRLIDTAGDPKFYHRYLNPSTTRLSIASLGLKPKDESPAVLHPELLLALHFVWQRREREASAPRLALSYIGTSRLSCLPCHTFLHSLETADILFSTRGTHGKVYFPWDFPHTQLVASGLSAGQRGAIVKYFASRLTGVCAERVAGSLERGARGIGGESEKWDWEDEDEVVDEEDYEWDVGGGSLPGPVFVMAVLALLMMVGILVAMWRR